MFSTKASALRALCNGTICNTNSDWHIMGIHGQIYLGIDPPLWAAHILISADGSCCMRMNLAVSRVGHHPLAIRVLHNNCQEFFPSSFVAPRQKRRWIFFQSPYSGGRSRHGGPLYVKFQNPINELTVVYRDAPPRASATRQMRL